VPGKTLLDIPSPIQEQMLAELRHARFNYLLAIHILLLCANGHSPTEIAAYLFCSRSSVYRTVHAYRNGKFTIPGSTDQQSKVHYIPSLHRSLLFIIKSAPTKFGWCRSRWSCALLAMQLQARRGVKVSQETIRRWLHNLGYVYKRARHAALDNDPDRASKLARIRHIIKYLRPSEVLLFADELDIELLAKIGCEWMKKGTQSEVMTPGKNEKRYMAAALDYVTGKILHVVGDRKTRWLFIDLLIKLDSVYKQASKIYVVVDNYRIHKAKDVVEWLSKHPRVELVWLPKYCPKANPIERAIGDVHDCCTRNHKRSKMGELVEDVEWHFKLNGPWKYKLSRIYYSEEVEAALEEIEKGEELKAA
jgi:transposase